MEENQKEENQETQTEATPETPETQESSKNMMMNKYLWVIGLLVVLGLGYYLIKGRTQTPITTEVTTQETSVPTMDDEAAIKQAVYTKFNSDATKLKVTVSKIDGNYATGGIVDVGSEVGGGYFLAAKWQGNWVIVHDGQAQPTCAQIAPYDFPVSMVSECLDASGKVVKR